MASDNAMEKNADKGSKPKIAQRISQDDESTGSSFVDLMHLVENQDDEQTDAFNGWLNKIWPPRWGRVSKQAIQTDKHSADNAPTVSRESYDPTTDSNRSNSNAESSQKKRDSMMTNTAPEGLQEVQIVVPPDVISVVSSDRPSSVDTDNTPHVSIELVADAPILCQDEKKDDDQSSQLQPDTVSEYSSSDDETEATETTKTTVVTDVKKPEGPQFAAELQELNDMKIATLVQEMEDEKAAEQLQKELQVEEKDRAIAQKLQGLEKQHGGTVGVNLVYDGSSGDEIVNSDLDSEDDYSEVARDEFWGEKHGIMNTILIALAILIGGQVLGWAACQVWRTTDGLYWGPGVWYVGVAAVLMSGYYLYTQCTSNRNDDDDCENPRRQLNAAEAYAGLQAVVIQPNVA